MEEQTQPAPPQRILSDEVKELMNKLEIVNLETAILKAQMGKEEMERQRERNKTKPAEEEKGF